MEQDYPAWKAKTKPRFVEINRRVTNPEMNQAYELARAVRLWRLDDRWRSTGPSDYTGSPSSGSFRSKPLKTWQKRAEASFPLLATRPICSNGASHREGIALDQPARPTR